MGGEFPSQPMLYIHGEDCGCIGIEVAKAAQATAPAHVRFEYVSNAGHFVHVEQPDRVNRLIVDFLAS
jgi:pimeloyl-ACP methyl ester carboxylesterase